MKEYEPNEMIVNKACALWVDMLSNPRFDALGKDRVQNDDPNGSMAMAQMLAANTACGIEISPESFDSFIATLKTILMSKTTNGYYQTGMGVDYNPDMILSQAAEIAEIPQELFPWKTNMYLRNNSLSLSYGYCAEAVNYYPINDKWLVTKLCGSDISKVIEYVKGGKPEFDIKN